jgi:hypothetical protein
MSVTGDGSASGATARSTRPQSAWSSAISTLSTTTSKS